MSDIAALAHAETKLLLRNSMVTTTALLLPVAMALLFTMSMPDGPAREAAGPLTLSFQVIFALGFTVYFTVTAAVTSRRQDLYLKRLCSAEPSAVRVLAGTLLPVVIIGLFQVVVMFVLNSALGGPVLQNVVLAGIAALGGVAMCVLAGLATSGFTSTAEQAQITTVPLFLALALGTLWGAMSPEPSVAALAVPGGAIADLLRRSVTEGDWVAQFGASLPAIGALLAWTVVAGVLARYRFRWDPRG